MSEKKNIYKALAGFQQEVPAIHKGVQGYGYTYADLKTIFKVINPLLKKYNLGFTQLLEGDNIKTIVFHTETGESIESCVEIPKGVELAKMNVFQVTGSGITYYRRYSLSSILGLVTDSDTDANDNQPPEKEPIKKQPVKKQPVKKAEPKKKEVKVPTVWITDVQFAKAIICTDPEKVKNVIDQLKLRPEQQEELQEIYNNLKSNQ